MGDATRFSAERNRGGWLAWIRRHALRRALTVGVDLRLMRPGGANGGVKPLVFSFLGEIGRTKGRRLRLVFLAASELEPELRPLLREGDGVWADEVQAPRFDVLYAPFGRSSAMRAGVPTVSLIVDLLHRDLPEALPIEEVNYRHEWFTQVAAEAAFFQCISHYTAARLQAHYGVDPARCFVTHLPVQGRLQTVAAESGAPPVAGGFFLYPANFWPHKNHERLLAAYRNYCDSAGAAAWRLVLTGHPDARMASLQARAEVLGLVDRVCFAGHLDEARFAAAWRAAGALVYPSLHEGFGIPLLEAMAFGRPILAANTTSLPEVGGDACLYVDPRDEMALAAALGRIAGEAELRRALVTRGGRRLKTFSLAREAGRLAEYFARAAKR